MSTELQFVFYSLALVCWIVAAVMCRNPRWWWPALIPAGLAFATFPHWWDLAKAL